MFKKLFVILSLAVISCSAAAGDQEEGVALGAGAGAGVANQLGNENFATAEAFADQCRAEGDYATYNEWLNQYGPGWEEIRLQRQVDDPYYFGYRASAQIQSINRIRLNQLKQARRDQGRDWMLGKIPDRQSRLRIQQSEREQVEAAAELQRILGNGQAQKAGWQIRNEQRQERERLIANLENNNVRSGFTSRESIRSLHPYLTYSIFGFISLFFMYKFANKNSEEIKN